jgi:glycosyltransferase involved in cell wall biosynthesis
VIVADGDAPESADSYVFLSWGYFQSFGTDKPKLHLDGAIYPASIEHSTPNGCTDKIVFLYSGVLNEWGGVFQLITAFRKLRIDTAELWITGKGDAVAVRDFAAGDDRIKVLGLLEPEKLSKVYARADIFVNPRPVSKRGNERNFPSKLFDYLSYGKPVVSTWTAGLSPAYRKLLTVVEPDTQEQMTLKLSEAAAMLSRDDSRLGKGATYMLPSWSDQARRLIQFIFPDNIR